MDKAARILCTLALATLLCACGSSRKAVNDDIYGDPFANMSSEEFILNEFILDKAASPSFTRMLMQEAYSWRGTPYRYGGKAKSGTDCSGFTMMTFLNALGIELPRNSAKQAEACRKISRSDLRPGDLVFFHGGGRGKKINHVGIYVGNHKMLHASGSRGVMESDIREDYFERHFHHAGRVTAFEKMLKKEKQFQKY